MWLGILTIVIMSLIVRSSFVVLEHQKVFDTGRRVEIRSGGSSGTFIAIFSPSNTGGLGSSKVQSEFVLIDNV